MGPTMVRRAVLLLVALGCAARGLSNPPPPPPPPPVATPPPVTPPPAPVTAPAPRPAVVAPPAAPPAGRRSAALTSQLPSHLKLASRLRPETHTPALPS